MRFQRPDEVQVPCASPAQPKPTRAALGGSDRTRSDQITPPLTVREDGFAESSAGPNDKLLLLRASSGS